MSDGVPWGEERLPFEEDAIRDYLDACIRHYRESDDSAAHVYVDAYQSVRTSILGEPMPEGEPVEGEEE